MLGVEYLVFVLPFHDRNTQGGERVRETPDGLFLLLNIDPSGLVERTAHRLVVGLDF